MYSTAIKFALQIVLSIFFLYYVFSNVEVGKVKELMLSIDPYTLLLSAFIVFMGTVVIQSAQIYLTLVEKNKYDYYSLCKINIIIMFYSFWLPTILVAGIRWVRYKALLNTPGLAIRLIGFHKLIQIIISLLGFLVAGFFIKDNLPVILKNSLAVGLVAFIILSVYFIFFLSKSFLSFFKGPRFVNGLKNKSDNVNWFLLRIYRVFSFLSEFKDLHLKDKILVLLLAVAQHGCIVLSAYLVLLGFDSNAPFWPVLFCRSMLVILFIFPLSLSGVGLREYIYFIILPIYGVDPANAASAAFCMLGIQLLMASIGGLVDLFNYRKC